MTPELEYNANTADSQRVNFFVGPSFNHLQAWQGYQYPGRCPEVQ
jgi:hypothetical protein